MGQVREAIGVTLSVLCSNIQLYASVCHDCSHEGDNVDLNSQLQQRSWIKFLKERASEVVVNIQHSNQSDSLETKRNTSQNGQLNGDSQDDIKWMETVLTFLRIFYGMFYAL